MFVSVSFNKQFADKPLAYIALGFQIKCMYCCHSKMTAFVSKEMLKLNCTECAFFKNCSLNIKNAILFR